MAAKRIAIIGGGLSGASAAVQLVRKSPLPLDITVIEPREEVGPGLAYSTSDPGFRLNAHAGWHSIDVADPAHFIRWCETNRLRDWDPKAIAPNGQAFVRRGDFGRYLAETVRAHAHWPATGSAITHRRAHVTGIRPGQDLIALKLRDGGTLEANQIILATGNPPPRLPAVLAGELVGHDRIRANPLGPDGFKGILPNWRVLVIGAGLTALDVIASLLSSGHKGKIVAVSRRGLRPRPQMPQVLSPPPQTPGPVALPLDLLNGPLPAYATPEMGPPDVLRWTRGMRDHIRAVEAQGQSWHAAFDAFIATVWRTWPLLPLEEKLRFLRRLRPWYEAHRFRSPPMTEAIVNAAEQTGQVTFRSATPTSVSAEADGSLGVTFAQKQGAEERDRFDAIINCTGLESGAAVAGNSLLQALMNLGWLTPHPTGLGFVVDDDCSAVGPDGIARPKLRIIGPPTAGVFGDPLGVVFISAQIHRMIPRLLADPGYRCAAAR